MSDQFEFPQPSKRRRISTTYATRRSTLEPNPASSPASEGLRTSRKSSRSSKSNIQSEQHPTLDSSVKNSVAQELPFESTVNSPFTHELNSNTDSPANQDSTGKRQLASRKTIPKSAVTQTSRKRSQNEEVEESEEESVGQISLDRDSTPPSHPIASGVDDDEETTIIVQPRSSGRERKRPRRYSISPQKPKSTLSKPVQLPTKGHTEHKANKASPEKPLRGILTPSRRGEKRGPRKSVVFDKEEKDLEQRFGFKDIGISVKKTRKTQPTLTKSETSREVAGNPVSEETHVFESIENRDNAEEDEDISIEQIIENTEAVAETDFDETRTASLEQLNDSPSLLSIRATVLGRIINPKTPASLLPTHLQSQYKTVHDLLTSTITVGESNSLLILGSRGCGKSHLLAHALGDLDAKYRSDFHVVRLNGFFQTDDRIALREIWRQLGREMNTDEDETNENGGSYADTMASLLTLLSHPEEFGMSDRGEETTGDVDQRMQSVSKSIVFVLDEFDLFTTHPRQTLLYNLFDIAQSRKAPIAVIGCSTRMDVIDCLEKRVKSRFSHRWIHIPSTKSLEGFQEIVKGALCVQEDLKLSKIDWTTREDWNRTIESIFLPSETTQMLIKRIYNTSKSLPELFASLYVPIATMQLSRISRPIEEDVSSNMTVALNRPSMLNILLTVSTIHLSLLIAAARLEAIHNLVTVNFNLVYNHYTDLITRSKLHQTASGAFAVGAGLRQWSRETAKGAWEDLSGWHMIVPATMGASGKDGNGDTVGGEGASVRMCRVDVTLDELNWSLKERRSGIVDMLEKWCREV